LSDIGVPGPEANPTEAVVVEAEARFRAVFERAAVGVAVVDLEHMVREANPALCRMLGYEPEELKGMDWEVIIQPDDAARNKAAYLELLAGLTDSLQAEVRFGRKDGAVRRGHITISVVRGADLSPSSIVALLEDITERREVEDKLRLTEREVSTLLDSIPAYAFLKDTQGRFITANRKFCDAVGMARADLVGKTDYDITSKALADKYAADDARVLSTGEAIHWEGPWAERGKAMVAETTKLPLKGERGRILGIIGLVYDITERKTMEAALLESEKRYKTLFEESPIALMVEDFSSVKAELDFMARGGVRSLRDYLASHPPDVKRLVEKVRLVDANAASVRLFEAEGKGDLNSLYQILSEEALAGFVNRFVALAEGRTEFETETVNRTLSGKLIPVIVRYIVPPGSEKTYSRIIVSVTDLSRIREDEEALRSSEEKYRELVENARSVILKQDLQGRIISCNEFCEEFFGFAREELLGRSVIGTIAPETESTGRDLRSLISDIYAHPGKYANNVNENLKKDGTRVWMHWSNSVVKDVDGKHIVLSVGMDITDRKIMEEDLKRYSGKLEEMVKERTRELNDSNRQLLKAERLAAIGSVAAQVGHDLRSPLTAVRTNLFYVQNVLPAKERRKLEGVLKSMDDSLAHANGIITDLFDYSKKTKLKMEELDLGGVLGSALRQVSFPAEVKLVTKPFPEAPVSGDSTHLVRIFQNIIFNAIDAMPKGGTLTISLVVRNRKVVLSFADTGQGISKDNMAKLFTPFFTTKPKGTGLGLAICKRLVEAHRGTISVASKLGRGTTFSLSFPISKGPSARSPSTLVHTG
jgi:PAS domain S-box-containing protein